MPTSARDVALRILELMFAAPVPGPVSAPAAGSPRSLRLAPFQEEGVARLRQILARRGGAVLADSVGLGKTYMALALVAEQLAGDGDALVIAPAALRSHWRRARRRLGSAGKRCRILSHTQLARGVAVAPPENGRLVVVDEAHRFRNPATLRYAALARIATAGTRLLLVTATPVNNRPEDLLNLLRLFCRDDAFRDISVPSLAAAFERAPHNGGGATAPRGTAGPDPGESDRVRRVVRTVVVRRSRAAVVERFGLPDLPGATFPARAEPSIARWEDPALEPAVRGIAGLELAPYGLETGPSGKAGAVRDLLRLLLLKRLDSSRAALSASAQRLRSTLRTALAAADAGRLPSAGALRSGRSADEDPLQLLLPELLTAPAPPDVDLAAVAASIRRDLEALRRLDGLMAASPDPKLEALERLLSRLQGEKVVLFTEYRDTAEALARTLGPRVRLGRVDGTGAWLGARPAGRRAVVHRFAPEANGRRPPPERERMDLLVATDVLAEGLNLQDARHVISYELPWNPVRLLQRIGRIDRLGSSHAVVVPHLFVPARGLDEILGLRRRLQAKLGHISATVGAEEAGPLLDRLAHTGDGAGLHRMLLDLERSADDPMERLRTLWVRHRSACSGLAPPHGRSAPGGTPGCTPRLAAITVPATGDPPWIRGVGLARAPATTDGLSAGPSVPWTLLVAEGSRRVAPAEGPLLDAAAAALEAALEAGEAVAPGSDSIVDRAANGGAPPMAAIRSCLAARAAEQRAPPPLPPRTASARLAHLLRQRLASAGAALSPDLVQRADRVLERLTTPLPPSSAGPIRRLFDTAGDEALADLLHRIEGSLALDPAPSDGRAGASSETPALPQPVVAAWLEIRTDRGPEPRRGPEPGPGCNPVDDPGARR